MTTHHVEPTPSALPIPTLAIPAVADRNAPAQASPLRDTVVKRMSLSVVVVHEVAALLALRPEWEALVATSTTQTNAFFVGPRWLVPWWHAYHQTLGASPYVLLARDANHTLVGVLPMYRRQAKVGPTVVTEIRMIGDAGPRPPSLDIIAAAGFEAQVGAAFARTLIDDATNWDSLVLEPLADPSAARANLVSRLASAGFAVESAASAGGSHRIALALAPADSTDGAGVMTTFGTDIVAVRKGMSSLRRLSRLEWAERDENSPFADGEAAALLEEVALTLGRDGHVRMARLEDASGEAVAAALVVDDGAHAVVLAMAVDPHATKGAAIRLLHGEALAARSRGREALEVVGAMGEHPLPMLPTSKHPAVAVRVWSHTKTAAVAKTYESVAKHARRARETPAVAAAQARAAWSKIRTTAANVAQYEKYSLYKGQLWTRGVAVPAEVTFARFDEAAYQALDDAGRADLAEQLHFDESVARTLWRRGDWSMLARLSGRPAGIAWSARGPIEAPELGRVLRMSKYDVYIHSVFVAPAARGRAVAPAMLEALIAELRNTDAYRSWALIAADNQPSQRAFQKASFTPVCEVVYAKLAAVDKIAVRPPDPEAKELLGLT